jgi:DNA-binding transcriptional LysR family regulator
MISFYLRDGWIYLIFVSSRTVVLEGGITRAAERLHRVQSNITTRVRQLEEDLGVALFLREGKKLHLSPSGQILLDYTEQLLALAEEAHTAVQGARPQGAFRLGSIESVAAVHLPALFSEYHRSYPEVSLELRIGNSETLSRAILAGDIDAALVEPIADAPFEMVPAFREELVIVSALGDPPVRTDDGRSHSIIAFEHGCRDRQRLERWYESKGEIAVRTIELGSYHAMLGCVVAGMGVALLPRSVLDTFPQRELLAIHQLPQEEKHAEIKLVWRKGAGSPNIRALGRILHERAPKLPAANLC